MVLGYGIALGALIVPTLGESLKRPVPCPLASSCAEVAALPISHWNGVPIGWLGVLSVLVVLLLSNTERTLLIARAIGMAAAGYAIYIQKTTIMEYRLVCSWCILGAIGLTLGAIARLFAPPLRVSSLPFGMVGLAIPLLATTWMAKEVLPPQSLPITSVKRSLITGRRDDNGRDIVLFASPECPACQTEVAQLIVQLPKYHPPIIRFAALKRTSIERKLAAYAHIAAARGRTEVLKTIYSKVPTELRLALASRLLKPTPAELAEAFRLADADNILAHSLKVAMLPTVLECPPREACHRVEILDLLEIP